MNTRWVLSQIRFSFCSLILKPWPSALSTPQSLARLAAAAGGDLAPEADAAVRRLADAWLDSALAAACGAARRRRSSEVAPDDAITYLERTWCVLTGITFSPFTQNEVLSKTRVTTSPLGEVAGPVWGLRQRRC